MELHPSQSLIRVCSLTVKIHQSSTSSKIEDQVFWYRADPHEGEDWRVCLDTFWDMSRKIKSAEDAEEQDESNDDFSKPFGRNRVQVDVRRLT